ncbi:unnamed protein product [Caenorhabditis auriculariae]|uniref:SRP54-type proteins GTP-binding domain-containing protein n=1 Tax=Caenorhabditis auriculariae TaxID=2777116 RepID=A0A8S1H936_9PELO|nr:unnamed protein product [Caenorhabditis auriculariae]
MIELFSIFSKGGIVLWSYQEGTQIFKDTINNFIKDVLMQERGNTMQFKDQNYTMKFHLDNELDVVFLVVYQSIVQLSYTERLMSSVRERFRKAFYTELQDKAALYNNPYELFESFDETFQELMIDAAKTAKAAEAVVKKPKTFQESAKSQKNDRLFDCQSSRDNAALSDGYASSSPPESPPQGGDDEVRKRREEFFSKKNATKAPKSPEDTKKKNTKQARVWNLSGKAKDAVVLDRSDPKDTQADGTDPTEEDSRFVESMKSQVGQHKGELRSFADSDTESDADDDVAEEDVVKTSKVGWFGMLKGLVGDRKLSQDDLQPVIEKMRDNLIMKNVAAEPAEKICQSVVSKLDGKVINNFSRVANEVKTAVREALVQLLTPKHRVDILRDVVEAKRDGRPYVIVFCGVNGVGKSTNLAKITFWLNENGHRVLIAAGDTFRAGAVEQLRTHTRHLNALHPNSVQLYEQGYGKDSAGLAAAAIKIASERAIDVVLVDTAGRMQDNEPLMRELAKLIRVNEPDLVLFVGEALVGNEAVDQLVKFNEALANHAATGQKARLIDGIVLTKFDTIDDKVGAAVSMTYITGQPIVFVGCGQTYADLRNLNVGAVVHSLLS